MDAKESNQKLKSRAQKLAVILHKTYPDPKIALDFSTPLQLIVATILSAQCTDVRVNMVTPSLFKKYRAAKDFANAKQEELEQEIRSTGFFRNKAKSIIACCRTLVEKHDGKVPKTMEELVELGGVGRKTANCVLGGAFGINAGVVVDTHVRRVSQRLGLSSFDDPERIETDLMQLIPQDEWFVFGNMLVWHGRKICDARKPDCLNCPLRKLCPSADEFLNSRA
ncbi:MAG: endonuclease III [Ignavibacteriales bacterium]|nr:endonuclease III [Ignavibacteriales bacterium]